MNFVDTLEKYYSDRDDQGNLRAQEEPMPDELDPYFDDEYDEELDDLDENDEMEDRD